MKLILLATKPLLHLEFQENFQDLPNVEIFPGKFEQLPEFDCIVSAANSFGLMDGGIDLAIIDFFGKELMAKVQQNILTKYLGEQPVGTSMIVETGDSKHPFIAHTPTMRLPMSIAGTDNVYSAMWAMLLAVRQHNQSAEKLINIIACPGLGTATGKLPFSEAAKQMALAYQNFLHPPQFLNWEIVTNRPKPLFIPPGFVD